ncbi:hypothetical protein K474DRAFT_64651 [Panus rudis PR-1116 ss-1]|nr:hypothetical protein K474DRAFT_64651 [Panus rudis PR-1116 ss-1]
MPHAVTRHSSPNNNKSGSSKHKLTWKQTTTMNMRDLSRDDDFLSHLLVEKLGTGTVPLVVHKMDPTRRLPKSDADELLQIVRRVSSRLLAFSLAASRSRSNHLRPHMQLVVSKSNQERAIRTAVDELLAIPAVRYYLRGYTPKQINAFATHASRYFELYLPSGSIEIAHTSRYSHRTGKSELCILATRPLAVGQVINELKGSMADLSPEEDKELKRSGGRHGDGASIRRDFSVIHSRQMKKNHLFLGPARFVNHDCEHNVELFRSGRYITFRVIRPIAVGEEVVANYGDGYFGRGNRHCLCATCERKGRGGYRPHASSEEEDEQSDSAAEVVGGESEDGSSSSDCDEEAAASANVNERRTRRGVYAVIAEDAPDVSMEVEGDIEEDVGNVPGPSTRTRSSSRPSTRSTMKQKDTGLMTPDPEPSSSRGRTKDRTSVKGSVAGSPRRTTVEPVSPSPVRYKSIISTRAQKAREASTEASVSAAMRRERSAGSKAGRPPSENRQLITPPLTADNSASSAANSVRSSSRLNARRAASAVDRETSSSRSTPVQDKGKGRATASVSDARDIENEPERETRSLRPRNHMIQSVAEHILAKKIEDRPRGLDGKPLPTCVTCGNVLPVISVDDEVVWGLSVGRTGKRGRPRKHQDTECPRCIRHYAIYAQKWPDRVPGLGSSFHMPPPPRWGGTWTPTETSSAVGRKLTNSALAALNRSMATTASDSASVAARSTKRAREAAPDDARPSKKLKSSPTNGRPRGRPPKHKVNMSAEAKAILSKSRPQETDGRRSGRTRRPSLKLRESEPPSAPAIKSPTIKLRITPRKNADASSSPTSSPTSSTSSGGSAEVVGTVSAPPLVANPGRPVTPPPSSLSHQEGSLQRTPKSMAVASQPREANGRFGKKASTNGRYKRKGNSLGGKFHRKRKPRVNLIVKREPDEGPGVSIEDDSVSQHGRDADVSDEMNAARDEADGRSQQDSSDEEGDDEEDDDEDMEDDDPASSSPVFGSQSLQTLLNKPFNNYNEEDTADPFAPVDDAEESANDEDDVEVVTFSSDHSPVFPKPGVGLLSRPNPFNFARRKWRQAPSDYDSDECYSSDPADAIPYGSNPHSSEESGEEDADEDASPRYTFRTSSFAGPMTFKPSPLNLAKRRWAPPPSSGLGRDSRTASAKPVTAPTSRAATPAIPSARSPSPVPAPAPVSAPVAPLPRREPPRLAPLPPSRRLNEFRPPPSGSLEDEDEADVVPWWHTEATPSDEVCYNATKPLNAVPHYETLLQGSDVLDLDDLALEYPDSEMLFERRMTPSPRPALEVLDSTDESERIVERLIAMSGSRPTSSSGGGSRASANGSTRERDPSPEYSPGLAWKRTVLLPTNEIPKAPPVIPPFPPAPPTKLIYAGWDTSSSDNDRYC